MRSAIVLLALGSANAAAQPANAEAQALFEQGVTLMDAGQLAEACTAFEASQERAPAVTTLLNIATCRERNGQLATAWGAYVEVDRETRGASDPTSQTLRTVAKDHVGKLQLHLSKLTISVPSGNRVPGLEVTREGAAVDAAAWGHALPVDGGTYAIVARAPGHEPWQTTLTISRADDAKTVVVPVLGAVVRAIRAPRSHRASYVLGGAAIVLGAAAIAFEVVAEHSYDSYQQVGGTSPLFDTANHERYAAEAFAAGALASAGVALWLYLRHDPTEEAPRIAIAPSALGMAVAGTF